ncbi:MAG: GNAT family acetyltransferase [Candidatus Marinimicrobia bacterium]|nr:GNAT family acetyltransferase [Candidatus Neomarinimicrobiota bacterium]MCF7850525.1 GNAT family acetyltransferase [Candidatus Neomarinimicrobiota bacterium]MCF7903962.1 GNAT family acetyltransferase [Candidatus Neomarinimicrobiota bacterium]
MAILNIRPFKREDEAAIVDLWHACNLVVPWNDPHRDIQLKLQVNPEWFLVGYLDDELIATVMAGYEGHRGWINYLAVHPDHQRQGHAKQLMEQAEMLLKETGCPKINLQVRAKNTDVIAFYKTLGYKSEDIVNLGKMINYTTNTEINDD